jgi:hypothetical protein
VLRFCDFLAPAMPNKKAPRRVLWPQAAEPPA